MNIARTILYFLGALLIIGGLVMLFFETGLAAWVPAGIALAGLIILVGLLLMGLSDRTTEPATSHVEHHEHHDAPVEHVERHEYRN